MGMHKAQAEPGTRPAHAESRPSLSANAKSWQSYFEDGLRLMGKVALENPKGRELEKALKEAHRNLAVSVKKGADGPEIFERLGDLEYTLGRWDAALRSYEISYGFYQGNARVCLMLGEVHAAFGMGNEHKGDSQNADFHYYRAEKFYARAIRIDPLNPLYVKQYEDIYKVREAFFATGKGIAIN